MTVKRLNWSTLKHIAVSPRFMRWRADHPRPDSPSLRLGRAIHCALLEPEAFGGRWLVPGQCEGVTAKGDRCSSQGLLYHDGGWYCRLKGHAPEGAEAPPAGIEVITAEESQLVNRIVDVVAGHPKAAELLKGGRAEQEIEWTDPEFGVACRGRLDLLQPNFILDLKTTRQDTVRGFVMDAARDMYHGQLAWYHDGAVAAGLLPQDAEMPYIIAASKAEPYDVAVYRLSEATYQAGQILKCDLLQKYVDCMAAEWWPGIAPEVIDLDLPDWAPGMNGSEDGGEW